LEEEWEMKIFEGSIKPLMKIRQIVSLDSKKDLSLKLIEFGRGFFIEVISKVLAFQ
jgi:hypothetical protein